MARNEKKNYKMLKNNKRLHTCISNFSLLISLDIMTTYGLVM